MDCSPPDWASLVAQLVKNLTSVWFLGWEVPLEKGKILWRRDRLPIPVLLAFSHVSDSKVSTCKAGDLGLIPGLGRSPGEGNGYPLWYSGLENSMDCIDHGVTKSWTQLSDFHFTSLRIQVKKAGWQYTALMYSFPNLEPVCYYMSGSNSYSWPAYKFLRRQVKWSGIPTSLRISYSLLWFIQSKALV